MKEKITLCFGSLIVHLYGLCILAEVLYSSHSSRRYVSIVNISDMDRKCKPRTESPNGQVHAQASDSSDNLGAMVTSRSGHHYPSHDYVGPSISRPIVTRDDVSDNPMAMM